MGISKLAGKPAPRESLVSIPRLVSAYYTTSPDPGEPGQMVSFGTSGHRGSSLDYSFTETHILAICQAIADIRRRSGITGPLFLGMDTHALSEPALRTALEVFAANGVELRVQTDFGYTPTPVISHAIIEWNRLYPNSPSDGVVITPSHNPPEFGGIKYNQSTGGPASPKITSAIEKRANVYIIKRLRGVRKMPLERAMREPTTKFVDFILPYVKDLRNIVDMQAIARGKIRIGVDPLGGSGIAFWTPIAETYSLNLEVLNKYVDPTFSFMTLDWDGQIRMDCSSPYAMASLIAHKEQYGLAFANDTDYDRHGIVTNEGLMAPNDYLAVASHYLFTHRSGWNGDALVGKTLVSSSIIDRAAESIGRKVCEVPVGFKWFVEGLANGSFGFAGEESAGATFLRMDGRAWTTDKDGFVMDLLAAEIMAVMDITPARYYRELTAKFGKPHYARIDAAATPEEKKTLKNLSPKDVSAKELAGEPITGLLTVAPGNNEPIDGLKVIAKNGWFAARPSGTENVYKIYAESFKDTKHLALIQKEAKEIVSRSLKPK